MEWWIVHREYRVPGELDAALANLAAEIYQIPSDRFSKHGKYSAEAMILRDEVAERNSMTEADWQKINDLLVESWQSLWEVVNDRL